MEPFDVGLLILRLVAGAVMIAHGINHGRNLDGTAAWFEKLGFRQARMQAMMSSGTELAVGAGLISGLLATPAAAGLAAIMVVAWVSNHRKAGFFVFNRPTEGWEYVMTLTALGVTIATLGAGEISLDRVFGVDLSGWTGLFIGLGGIVAGFGQLATFWRPPKETEAT